MNILYFKCIPKSVLKSLYHIFSDSKHLLSNRHGGKCRTKSKFYLKVYGVKNEYGFFLFCNYKLRECYKMLSQLELNSINIKNLGNKITNFIDNG